jgi:dTMP kinase
MALLFAADRLAHSIEIEETLRAGTHVICDRYIFSSMAYQSLDATIPGERVIELNRGCAIPDLTIFLHVPADVCLARVSARNESPTIYEKADLLGMIAANYERLRPLYEKNFGAFVSIDGTQSPDDVFRDVVAAVK